MPSKMVTDREKVDEALLAALATHRDKVLEGLQERLGPWLPDGVDTSGFTPYYDALAGLIAAHKEKLTEADRRTRAERLDDRSPRRRRDEVTAELRERLLAFRRAAKAIFGPDDGVELLHLEGRVRPDPKLVHRAAVDVLESLRSPDLDLPSLEVPGVQVQAAEWVARLEPLTTELGTLVEAVARDRQEASGAAVEKREAIAEHDREVGLARRYLLALLHLADQPALAEVVHRAIRNRARRSDVEALEEAAQPAVESDASMEGTGASDAPPAPAPAREASDSPALRVVRR